MKKEKSSECCAEGAEGVRSRYGAEIGQDWPRWAKMGQQKAETEQILDLRGTGQRRVADFGGLNQVRLNGPWPPPETLIYKGI